MTDPEKQWEANEIVGLVEDMLRPHEIEDHNGELCMAERAGFVAFLAHRLGVRDPESVRLFFEALAEYELGHRAQHDTNGHEHEQ
jgi:hypothetical protein